MDAISTVLPEGWNLDQHEPDPFDASMPFDGASKEWSHIISGGFLPEQSGYLAIGIMHDAVEGDLASVGFDRNLITPQVIGWHHTHPPGAGSYQSRTDLLTAAAWSFTLGRPLISIIEEGEQLRGWIWHNDDVYDEIAVLRRGAVILCGTS